MAEADECSFPELADMALSSDAGSCWLVVPWSAGLAQAATTIEITSVAITSQKTLVHLIARDDIKPFCLPWHYQSLTVT
jgi:hypothetical protein